MCRLYVSQALTKKLWMAFVSVLTHAVVFSDAHYTRHSIELLPRYLAYKGRGETKQEGIRAWEDL